MKKIGPLKVSLALVAKFKAIESILPGKKSSSASSSSPSETVNSKSILTADAPLLSSRPAQGEDAASQGEANPPTFAELVQADEGLLERRKRSRRAKRQRRIDQLINHFGGCCVFCAIPVNREENHKQGASAEHAIPLSKGGIDSNENLLLACRQCNNNRGSSSLIAFLKQKTKAYAKNSKRFS